MSSPKLFNLSVSKTKTFTDCKRKYKFAYIEKLPKKEWEHLVYGKFVHRILELFHLAYINGSIEEPHIVMKSAFKTAYAEYASQLTPEQKKEAFEACVQYLEKLASQNYFSNGKCKKTVLSVEKDFVIPLVPNEAALIGFIDRIEVDDDGMLHVADYKTTKNKSYLKNDFFQLLTYAYVLVMEDPSLEKVRGSYILIRHGFEYITTVFHKKEILAVAEQFKKYYESMKNEQLFRPNPTPLCQWCDWVDKCPEGTDLVQLRSPQKFGESKW